MRFFNADWIPAAREYYVMKPFRTDRGSILSAGQASRCATTSPYVLAKFVTHIIRDVVADHRRARVAPSRPKFRAAVQLVGTAILCAEDFTSVTFR